MLYHFIRPIVTTAFKIYFKKIYHTGGENIPLEKPILLVSNHPTAFFEPCMLACVFQQMELHFITRADIFIPPYDVMLKDLNMIPIYRFRDGFANMKNNAAVMEGLYKALKENKKILLFPESTTTTQKRLKPIQKGTARIAFGSYDEYGDLDLQILPIGFSYTDPHTFRTELMIQVGKPIPLRQYYPIHQENPNKAVNLLTQQIADAIKPLMVYVENPQDDPLAEQLLTLYRNTYPDTVFPILKKNKRRLMAEQEIANHINTMTDQSKTDLSNQINQYTTQLKNANVQDLGIAQPWRDHTGNLIALILGFIPFIIGYTFHFPAMRYAYYIRHTRVKQLEFEGPVSGAVAIVTILLTYLFFGIVALAINRWFIYAAFITLPIFGFYALQYMDTRKYYTAAKKANNLPDETFNQLKNQREAILNS